MLQINVNIFNFLYNLRLGMGLNKYCLLVSD